MCTMRFCTATRVYHSLSCIDMLSTLNCPSRQLPSLCSLAVCRCPHRGHVLAKFMIHMYAVAAHCVPCNPRDPYLSGVAVT